MTTEGHWAWRVPDTGKPSSFDEEALPRSGVRRGHESEGVAVLRLSWQGQVRAVKERLPRAPSVREIDGQLVVNWHGDRPDFFTISSDLFEALIEDSNWLRRLRCHGIDEEKT